MMSVRKVAKLPKAAKQPTASQAASFQENIFVLGLGRTAETCNSFSSRT